MTPPAKDDLERIDAKASDWIVRASADDFSAEDAQALARWRAADPRHESRFIALQRTWQEIPALLHLGGLAPLTVDAGAAKSRRFGGRFQIAAGAFAAAAAVVLVFATSFFFAPTGESFATEVAQMREVRLADGSVVTLGPKSHLTVEFSTKERHVKLTGGEAFFEVAKNPARPFFVEAGSSVVRVVGTKFDVNRGDGSVRVSVLQGIVQVRGKGSALPPSQTPMLHAGQRAEITGGGSAAPVIKISAAPSSNLLLEAGSWREGRLVYEDARLADLVSDVNRYYAPGVTLSDRATGELRVTASFKVREIPAFMKTLSDAVPVTAEARPGGAFRLISASDAKP